MNALRRLIASSMVAVLILTAPGPGAYANVVKITFTGSTHGAVSSAGAGGALYKLNGAPGLAEPAAGMSLSLNGALPSISVNPSVSPAIAPGGAVSLIAAQVQETQSHAVSDTAQVAQAVSPSAAEAAISQKTVLGRLSAVVSSFGRLKSLSGPSLRVESGKAFDNARSRGNTVVTPVAGTETSALSGLQAAGLPHIGEENISGRSSEVPSPQQKISRAIRVGALTAVLMLALDSVVMAAATYLGYQFTPSYSMPAMSDPAAFAMLGDTAAMILAKAQEFFTAAFIAPFNEEVYFRAAVMGLGGYGATKLVRGVVKVLEKIKPSLSSLRTWTVPVVFGIVATEAAMFFTLLHESTDPILIAVRIIQALLLSYLYVREGLVSGMVHHAVFNGLAVLTLPLIYTMVSGTMAVMVPQAMMFGIALFGVAYLIWRMTRATAREEAREMKAGRMSAYRLSERASTWLGRIGWASVALLAGIAFIQPTAATALMVGSIAAQMVPAVLAFQAYGFLLRNLKRREGAAAVSDIRNPKGIFPMANRVAGWVGGAFAGIYFGMIAGPWLLQGAMALFPGVGLTAMLAVAAALPVLGLLGILAYRLMAGRRGIAPWAYVAQYFAASSAAVIVAMPWIAPFLEKLQGIIAATDMAGQLIMPGLASLVWTLPLFAVLTLVMTLIARRLAK